MLSFWPMSGASSSSTAPPITPTPNRRHEPETSIDRPRPAEYTAPEDSKPPGSERRITVLSVVEQSTGVLGTVLSNPVGAAVAGISTTSLAALLWWRYFRRIPTAEYVTPAVLKYRKVLVGRVVTVGDADGFRFHHTPGPPFLRDWLNPWPPRVRSKNAKPGTRTRLVRETISVRIAGVDAPESAHFGKPAQPYSKEAKDFLTSMVQSPSSPDNLTAPKKSFFSSASSSAPAHPSNDVSTKVVWLYPSHIDQYKRLVATPYVWEPPYVLGKTNVSLAMVKQGLATVYRSAGADYGQATWWARFWRKSTTGLTALERAETKAKRQKTGMWSLGKKFESPEDYKKRIKGET
ncbi:nuclease domain containing protein [Moesziomyces antarcticus]|uniref:TNase-like domain-containing protein n=1 Tax=Pseudozyma antarctica TaxID=84753 RepID=A0A5C3FJ53_PSEA2|nr:nuclease domain containing protein [Moesziomyces antarcticus]GAK63626.1 nuclease domain containing protein [Moesziomyces antarcticus]SPO44220.1 uncharacterized protein PSANT_01905 [Moesziomyces antarcticus]